MLRATFVTAFVLALIACDDDDATPATTSPPANNSSSSSSGSNPSQTSGDSGVTDPPPPPSNVVTSTVSIDVNGTPRQYVLALPKTYDANKTYPLIVALHGDGEGADMFVTFSRLDVAAGADAVMAFTDQVLDLYTDYDQNPDQELVKAVVDDVKSKQNVDPKRVWGFGYSKGAYMLEELACRKENPFTAMAIHAGGAPEERNADGSVSCPGATAVPMFLTQGSLDQDTGSEFGADFWASVAGCQDTRSTITPAICGQYDGCNASSPIVYCEIPNQPHFPLYDNAASDSWTWFNSLAQ